MQVELIDINNIIPYSRNPRRNQAAIDKVAASIKEFGFRMPIVIDKDMVVIAGHTRLLAAHKLNLKEVPVHKAGNLSEAQVKAYRLADNRVAQESEWDNDLLTLELQDLSGLEFDLNLTGFDQEELQALLNPETILAGLTDEDDCPELPDQPITTAGDIWLLGKHRIMCGDSTSVDALEKLMAGRQADMIFTDPPYNVGYNPDTRPIGGRARSANKLGGIKNDKMDNDVFLDFLRAVFFTCITALKGGGAIYVCHADAFGVIFRTAFEEIFKLASVLIWAKNNFSIGRSDYHWMHEPILYGWRKDNTHSWHGDRSQTTVWNISRDAVTDYVHPTQKPVALPEKAISNSSKSGDIVLDMFGGSGSTLIACQKTGRINCSMELDPKYCDVIINRWQEFTGGKAILESTKNTFDEIKASSKSNTDPL